MGASSVSAPVCPFVGSLGDRDGKLRLFAGPLQVMQKIGDEHVSFVFTLEVDGKAVDPEPPLVPPAGQQQGQRGRGLVRQGTAAAAPRPVAAQQQASTLHPAAVSAPAAQQPAAPTMQAQQAGAALPPVVQQEQQHQQSHQLPASSRQQHFVSVCQPAKENAAANKAPVAKGVRLALPSRHKPSAPGPAKRPAVVTAVRQVVAASDSDDDFK